MSRQYPTYRLGPKFRTKLRQFTRRFIDAGFTEFAEEFRGIDEFVARARCDDRSEGERSLRTTPKEKYLLEAVSFEIYDNLNRETFNQTSGTLIVLPDCLSLHNPDCEKTDSPYGDQCLSCTKSCQAFHVVQLAEKYGATAVFSKRKLSEQIEYYSRTLTDMGVIGIACMTMLAGGMRTAAEVGVPARGVLLSFTGCGHWNDRAFASRFPMSWLKAILREKYGK